MCVNLTKAGIESWIFDMNMSLFVFFHLRERYEQQILYSKKPHSATSMHQIMSVVISVVNESYSAVFSIVYSFRSFLYHILAISVMSSTLSIRHAKKGQWNKIAQCFVRFTREMKPHTTAFRDIHSENFTRLTKLNCLKIWSKY